MIAVSLQMPRPLDFGFGDRVAFCVASSRCLGIVRASLAGADGGPQGASEGDTQDAALAAQVQQLDGLIRQQQWREICMLQLQQLDQQQQQQQDDVQERELWVALLDALEDVRLLSLLPFSLLLLALLLLLWLVGLLLLHCIWMPGAAAVCCGVSVSSAGPQPWGLQPGGAAPSAGVGSRSPLAIC